MTHSYPSRGQLEGAGPRYSSRHSQKPVSFYFVAPHAQTVCVVGDFNDWTAGTHPMTRRPDGSWHLMLPLSHGHHQYLLIVDGKPFLDPKAQGVTRNRRGERVSMLSVS